MSKTTLSVRQIKQLKHTLASKEDDGSSKALPTFWITDWLLYVLDKPALFLMTDDHYELSLEEYERFSAGVEKMKQGIPLAYLTGQQAFWSLEFKVNAHTLIPRPDTEVLIEQVLAWIDTQTDNKLSKRLLDLGTGSGCIAISLAYELNQRLADWEVIAVDISNEALKVAQYNAQMNHTNVTFIASSWYAALGEDKFDVIVSNPPYIDEQDAHLIHLQAEPISALSAPKQGMADIEHIIKEAPKHLHRAGLLAIEHGYDQGAAVRALFINSGFEAVHTIKDYGGNERVTLGQRQL